MAVRNTPRSLPQDENAVNPLVSGRAGIKGNNGGLVTQERKKLSNITNKLQPLGPSASAKANAIPNPSKVECTPVQSKAFSKNPGLGNKASQISSVKTLPPSQTPLTKIAKEGEGTPKLAAKPSALKRQTVGQSGKWVWPSSGFHLSEEQEKKAEMWAQEGIEQVHFSGKDMEMLREKMEQEEMERRIALALAYRTDFPSMLPQLSRKEADEMEDALKIDPFEEIYIREHPEIFLGLEQVDPREDIDDITMELHIDSNSIPPIPHDLHMVRDDVIC